MVLNSIEFSSKFQDLRGQQFKQKMKSLLFPTANFKLSLIDQNIVVSILKKLKSYDKSDQDNVRDSMSVSSHKSSANSSLSFDDSPSKPIVHNT